MAIKQTLQNFFTFFTALSPLFISTFLLLNSFLNGDLKGMVFLVGSAIASIIGVFIKKSLVNNRSFLRGPAKHGSSYNAAEHAPTHDFCDVFEPLDSSIKFVSMPSSHALFFGYLLMYMGYGIGENPSEDKPGLPFIIGISSIALFDLIFRFRSRCDGIPDIMGGLMLGALIGFAWYMLIRYTWPDNQGPKIVYFLKEDLNTEKCKLGKTSFKCKRKS
tara:strand:+ start:419 stop:1072 length:654 start_codon:yes stop_codon:yes gene_type:complete